MRGVERKSREEVAPRRSVQIVRVLVVVLLLLATACGVEVLGQGRAVDVLTFQRPGYPPTGPAIGDYGGLVSRQGEVPVHYRGAAVVQACALMTPEDLAGLGLNVRGGIAAGMVSQNMIDGAGDVAPYYLGSSWAPNSCGYATGEVGLVDVAVHQPAYAGSAALGRHLRDEFGAPVDRGGVAVHEPLRPYGDLTLFWVRLGDVHVELVVDAADELEAAVLDHVVRRLPDVVVSPTGPLDFDYASPAFSAAFLNSCAISAWEDLGGIAGGRGASAQIEEGISPGIGLIVFGGGPRSNYVMHTCQRRAAGDEYLSSPALTVRTRSFDVDGASAAALAFERELGAADTAEMIGEESVVSTGGRRPVVLFRRGSVVVEVEYYPGDEAAPADPVAVLLPVARAVDARVAR